MRDIDKDYRNHLFEWRVFKVFVVLGILAVLSIALYTACSPVDQKTDFGASIETQVDPRIYEVRLQIMEPAASSSRTETQVTSGEYYSSVQFSTTGKGIVRGYVLGGNPLPAELKPDQEGIVKTTDLKILAAKPGDVLTLICIRDYEPVCAKREDSTLAAGECYEMWEVDGCRLLSFEPQERAGK